MNKERYPLERYDNQTLAEKCARCGTCRVVYADNTASVRFSYQCPSGTRYKFESFYPPGRMYLASELYRGKLTWSDHLMKIMYACTLCGSCTELCKKVNIITPCEIIEDLRSFAYREGRVLPGHKTVIDSLSTYDNPWLQPRTSRNRWTRKLSFKIKDASKESVDVLYYIGCTTGLDPVLQKTALATAELLHKAGVNFGILGNNERCCGSTARRIGAKSVWDSYAKENIKQFNESGFKTVVTSCAGCYRTLCLEYPEIGKIKAEIVTGMEYLHRLINEGKLSLRNEVPMQVTYHDPCHLGRHAGIYEEPRQLLSAIPGIRLEEMERNREFSWCCGGGGGVRSEYDELAHATASERMKEAEATGVSALITHCPFCESNLGRVESPVKVMDVMEVLAQSIL
jgi:Fe-S oxidoreductase